VWPGASCQSWRASPEAPIDPQQDHGCHLQALRGASLVAVVHQIAQLIVGEVLAVQQIPRGGIRGAAVCEATYTGVGAAAATAAIAASPLAGTLGGLMALALQQAQQRLAAISELPAWDA
jgi:hypothetical protein